MRLRALVLLVLLARPAAPQDPPTCAAWATDRWNEFAATANRYLQVRNQKERLKMRKQFEEVMRCECF